MGIDLYQNIIANRNRTENSATGVHTVTWLIFASGNDFFALESASVREILRNADIYPLPFVPSYIPGVLNRHGDPYAVIDIALFLGNCPVLQNLFLILNDDNDMALRISEIKEFYTAEESCLIKLSDATAGDSFSGALRYNDISVPVLNIRGITEKIRADLENN
jgi:purine-binding chemotaxis protein CheW